MKRSRFTDQQIATAWLRLAVVSAHLKGMPLDKAEQELTGLQRTLFASRNPQPILSDVIRVAEKPWLAMVVAFADSLAIPLNEITALFDDPQDQALARKQVKLARSWKPSQPVWWG